MCPILHFSYTAMFAAVAASFIFGFIWYGPLFGKLWMELMGKKIEDCKGKEPPVASMLLTLLGTIFTVLIMYYLLRYAMSGCTLGLASYVWLGFYVPMLISGMAWEGKSFKLAIFNACFYFLNLQLIAGILTCLK
jgi:hypothetical protein